MSANAPAVFNFQFFKPAVNGVAMVAAACKLHTYLNNTTTVKVTYTDRAGTAPNANPITLNDDGQCVLYLDPAVLYTLVLKDAADSATIDTWNDIGGAALSTGAVISVNGLTGIVTLDASGIPYTTSSAATWLTADNTESALDQIADRANAPPADSVPLTPVDGLAATNAQAAIAELAARSIGATLLRVTVFNTTGTWTKGEDVATVIAYAMGAGGGSNIATIGCGGGGGGGGAIAFVAAPAASVTVTVGAGGPPGSSGQASSFGTVSGASGGGPGGAVKGGIGGTGTIGDILMRGAGGGWGGNTGALSIFGHGGASPWGGGARGNVGGGSGDGASQAGDANTGGGGSGGTSGGAAGGSGAVWIYEYGT